MPRSNPWRQYLPLSLGIKTANSPTDSNGVRTGRTSIDRKHPLFEVGLERSIAEDPAGAILSNREMHLQSTYPIQFRPGSIASASGILGNQSLTPTKELVDYISAADNAGGITSFNYNRDENNDELYQTASPTSEQLHSTETLAHFSHRLSWLLVLLILQSLSSLVLKRFESLIIKHPVIILFLTMLIGAGGNVGSQSTVLAVRNITKGSFSAPGGTSIKDFIIHELWTGIKLAFVLAVVAVCRVYIFNSDPRENAAIGLAMFAIVITSVLIGTLMPLLLWMCRCDPAHAGAAIQVTIDIVGVTITCLIATTIFSAFS